MRKASMQVQDLAREARLELDDALIRLWEAGIDHVLDPTDIIKRDALPTARSALGLEAASEIRSIASWAFRLGLAEDVFRKRLSELGIDVSPAMRNLPKGSVAKVRRMLAPTTGLSAQLITTNTSVQLASDSLFEWRNIGKLRTDMSYLADEEVLEIHHYLVEQFKASGDPIIPAGVKYPELLSSAVSRPQTSLNDTYKYPTVEMAAAALLHSLTLNHAFHNGNKRTALVSMLVFLDRNDVALTASEPEVLKQLLRIARRSIVSPEATHRSDREVIEISEWIHNNQRAFTHGDASLQFRVLRRILGGFDCSLTFPRAGNHGRINISRSVEERTFLGRTKSRRLETQVHYRNEGAEVSRATINKIRTDLQLDEEHGCDSSAFYNSRIETIDQVIAQYQTTLKRLAKL